MIAIAVQAGNGASGEERRVRRHLAMEEQLIRERSRGRSPECGSIAEVGGRNRDGVGKSRVSMLATRRRAFASRALRRGRKLISRVRETLSFVRSG